MSYRDVLVLLLLIQGLATQLQSEKQIGGSFPRYRRQTSDLDLGHTEVGTRISRTCEYRDIYYTHYNLVWEVQTARVRRTVATCLAYPEPFICSVSSGFSSLFSVTTNETQTTLAWNADTRFFSLRCVQGKEIANWTLVTYSKPTDLTCRSPEFTDNSNTVSVTCVSSVIFPEDPRCVLYIQTAVSSRVQTSLPPSYGTDTAGSVSGPSCTFTIQASELGAGTHRLSVNMYPQFDGSGVNYGVNRAVFPDVTFYYPVPEIVNCPSGSKVNGDYIMSGSTATCECRQKTEGFPAGTVVLSQGRSTLGSGTVASGNVINPGNINNDQTLTCRSESSLGQAGPSVSETVMFAYGPSSATLTFSPTSPSSLCQGTSLSIAYSCAVDPRTVNPQAVYKISVNGTQVGTSVQQTLQLQGGAHNVRCLVENSLFPADLFTDVTETFTVLVPPPDPPEISMSKSSVLSTGETLVKENVTTSVQCVVRGGYPATSDVRLSCPSSQAGSSGVSSVVVTRSKETQCSCTATHDSGCYNKRSDVTIRAAYGPADLKLERKNVGPEEAGTYNLCPSATPDITMECSVGVVYPAASLTLTMRPKGTLNVFYCTRNNKCSTEFVPSRGGNHEFMCYSVNSAFADMAGDSPPVQVYVREPPKDAPKLTLNGKDFTGATAENVVVFVDGQENSVVCQVEGGFPEISPSDIYVQCDSENVTDGKVVFTPDRNTTNCICRAQHPSGCYDLSTEVLVIVILQNETKLQQSDDQMTILIAVGAAGAAFVICCVTTAVVYCYLKRKGCFRRMAKHKEKQLRSEKTQDNDGTRGENQYEEIDLDKVSIQDIHLPALVGKSLPKTTKPVCRREENAYVDIDADNLSSQDISTPVLVGKSSSGKTKPISRQEESPYVDVDLEHISSQDIQTPVLIGRTKVEIITPDATKTDGEGRRYDNVLVTSPVSRAGPGGQGQSIAH